MKTIPQINVDLYIKTVSKKMSDKEQRDFQKNLHIWLYDKLHQLSKDPYFTNVHFKIYCQ